MIESVNTMAEKSKAKALKEELFYAPKHMATVVEEDLFPKADVFAEGYKEFMSNYKTEREITAFFKAEAEKRGYTEFDKTKTYKPGDRVYRVNRNKCIILTVFGKKPLSEGLRIAASHIDSPRLDLKPNPLYEKDELAFFKTHYYGGIKKYQWTTIPLSLHGVIVKGDGTSVTVNIGEDEGDPQFIITDLLPHLAQEQSKKTLGDAIKGEDLNVLVGSLPFKGEEESELVKLNILKILNEKYGIVEEDFVFRDLDVDRCLGFTGDDAAVIAAAFQHQPKVAAAVGGRDESGQRRNGRDIETGRTGGTGTGQGACRDDDPVIFIVGSHSGTDVAQQDVACHDLAADGAVAVFIGPRVLRDGVGTQVDHHDLPHVSAIFSHCFISLALFLQIKTDRSFLSPSNHHSRKQTKERAYSL